MNHADTLTGLATLATLRGLDARPGGWTSCPRMTVFAIDLDRFRTVNDLLGYELGDAMLCAVGERLAGWASPGGVAARIGADQFVVVCPGHGGDTAAGARQLGDLVATPIELGSLSVSRSASVGHTSGTIGVDTVLALYRRADEARRSVKAAGGGTERAFEPAMSSQAFTAAAIELHLRAAVATDGLGLAYQPEFDLRSGALLAVEALVRWQHPTLGPLLPDQFIAIAEDANMMRELGEWVLREACRQRAAWEAALGGRPLTVRVNLSPAQLVGDGLVELVHAVLDETGLSGDQLCLELTERAVATDVTHFAAVLARLRGAGVTTAIDDFGTGHNSLTYLRSMPVDTLKIDRSFVAGLGVDAGDTAIIEALVRLAERLRIGVVAEGVETETEAAELLRIGCYRAQGHLLSEPLPAEHLGLLIREGKLGGHESETFTRS
jgi:diguanylate cyclase (GGDEF)-like protein